MQDQAAQPRRRRRVRHPAEVQPGEGQPGEAQPGEAQSSGAQPGGAQPVEVQPGDGQPVAVTPEIEDQTPAPVDADAAPSERGLRGLVGGGSSQVRPPAALRARDAARPREFDLARAEADLVIVRRNWSPRE